MNSPPMNGTSNNVAPKISVAITIVWRGCARAQSNGCAYLAFIHSKARFGFSRTPFLNQ